MNNKNILWAHDHKLREKEGQFFTLGGLSDDITKRYTDIFGEMRIICRAIPKQKYDKNLFSIENQNVKVYPICSKSLILTKKDKEQILELVKISEQIIVRLPSFIGDYVVSCCKKINKQYLVEMVTCPWDSLWHHSLKGKIVAPYMWYKTRKDLLSAFYTIYVTSHFLQNRYPTRGKFIGCSDVMLKNIDDSNLVKRLNKISNFTKRQEVVFGTLAALDSKYKGQQYVIRALSILKKRGFLFKYLLAGGGDNSFLANQIKKYNLENEVLFCGVIKHENVFEWIDNLDVYLQPSEQEGLPRSVIEAMSRACPIIGSNAGGIPELINKGCIFEKSKIKPLLNLLQKAYSKSFLIEHAEMNFKESKKYSSEKLNKKRNKFLIEFSYEKK